MMKQEDKMLKIAEHMFKGQGSTVSIGTKHVQSKELTVLIAGRVEFNSFKHRRDAWDVVLKFNIYFKKLEDGTYESGTHNPKDNEIVVCDSPTEAVSEMAYKLIKRMEIS